MIRTARCQCGGFRVSTSGEPDFVMICHCQDCQRRSGVPLTANAYFRREQAHIEGEYTTYNREGQDGRMLHNRFCPKCGSTICWTLDALPQHYGVAVGAFNDPEFPAPAVSIWEQSMYTWVALPPDIQHFPQGRTLPRSLAET